MPGEHKIRVGIVGLGHNGLAHIRAHRALGLSEVVALCDHNAERLRQAGAEFGITRLYSDDGIYTDPAVEAISIHTGDHQHREPVVRALRAGKHILVEKPLANSEEDVVAIMEAARETDPRLKIQVGYILRFNPLYEAIHRLARTGALGDIYYMESDYIHNLLYQAQKTDPLTGRNWYLEEEIPMVGGGSHQIDLLRWISGKEMVAVKAYANHFAFPAMRHEDCQVALFRFADGSVAKVAVLYAPRCARPPYCNLRLYGTRGTVVDDQVAIAASEEDVHPSFRPIGAERVAGHPFESEIADWLSAIRDDRPTRIDLADGANSTLAALRAVRALRSGREEEIPVFRP